jgi:hypothetical protein
MCVSGLWRSGGGQVWGEWVLPFCVSPWGEVDVEMLVWCGEVDVTM